MDISPNLTEPGVKFFYKNVLVQCNKFKENHYSILYNIFLIILFIIILAVILFFRYKGNINKEEVKLREKREKEYIMSKLIYLSDYKKKQSENLITNLPEWSNNPEFNILNNYR